MQQYFIVNQPCAVVVPEDLLMATEPTIKTTVPSRSSSGSGLHILSSVFRILSSLLYALSALRILSSTHPPIYSSSLCVLCALCGYFLCAFVSSWPIRALHLSSALYICRENSTNHPFLCKTNPQSKHPSHPEAVRDRDSTFYLLSSVFFVPSLLSREYLSVPFLSPGDVPSGVKFLWVFCAFSRLNSLDPWLLFK